jgi:lipopolysaccharide export system ATP-binding protein
MVVERLRAEGLTKIYNRRRVVDGLSVEVSRGEIVGLLGPNGAGKTTTFYMCVGLVKPNGGRVWLDGQDVTRVPMYRRARMGMGYLPQEPSIFRNLTVEQNLMAVLQMQPISRAEQRERTEKAIGEMHIGHIRQQPGIVLSGGERRRVEIARALVMQPSFMLLDEPFTGVDPITVSELKQIMISLKVRGIGLLLTDHNVRDTLAVTDRAYIISDGKILTSGPSRTLPDDPIARRFYLGEEFEI